MRRAPRQSPTKTSHMPDDNAPTIARPSVPIVLGVTGHRDLRDGDDSALRTAVAAILREFRNAYPHTPIVLLSSLAAGADQLAADVALEVAKEAGTSDQIVVRAPLPMPAPAYRRSTSFSTDEQRDRFDAMQTDRQVDCFEVPLPASLEARTMPPLPLIDADGAIEETTVARGGPGWRLLPPILVGRRIHMYPRRTP